MGLCGAVAHEPEPHTIATAIRGRRGRGRDYPGSACPITHPVAPGASSSGRRFLIGLAASISALVALLGVVAFGTYQWTGGEIQRIPEESPVFVTGDDGEVVEAPKAITGRCVSGEVCNYLLLGSDSREGLTREEQIAFGTDAQIGGENRADTIILVHTRPEQKEAVFLSFPRDLWVEIPGVGEGKINSAFEAGIEGDGAHLVARTVRNLTGIPIHHVMYVSLAGFQGLVDALDGVELCIPYPMQDELTGLDVAAGCQELDGVQSLAYVRTRHQPCDSVPDFARINRQQQFLRAVIAKILRPSELVRLPSLVPELFENLFVDEGMNPAELAYLAGTLRDVGTEDADFRSVPSIPATLSTSSGLLSIVKAVEPDATELFRRLRNGQPLGELGLELPGVAPSPANIVVSVLNRDAGAVAANVYNTLTEGGFNTSPGIVGADEIAVPAKGSMILYREGEEPMAKVVGQYFPNLELVPAPARTLPNGQDVAVIVTARYEIPPPSTEEPVDCPA
jgi:LCP family protein required for cell wall assembly